ncbi:MAG TPA: hypothetical protein VGV35_11045, partial [Bryobacteraceae bacterium]|nr:hypothetical protein [Bryobacteraceae bacterium]
TLSLPFIWQTTLRQQQYVFDCGPDRDRTPNFEYARYPITLHHALVRVRGDSRHVMSQQNSVMYSHPGEQFLISNSGESCVLRSNDIDIGSLAA